MGYMLPTRVSFCDVSDHLLFLDIDADRYFGLSARGEASFDRWRRGAPPSGEDLSILDALIARGVLLQAGSAGAPAGAPPVAVAERSLLDLAVPVAWLEIPQLALAILAAKARLRIGRLRSGIRSVEIAKRRLAARAPHALPHDRTPAISAAFEWTTRLMRSHDQCLPRSIAVATHLARHGIAAELVLGVKLRPFGAHAWVQADGWLVNDRFERVRNYTPILVV